MLTEHNPDGVAAPFSRYSHGIEAPARLRWLHVSGQVGIDAHGRLAADGRGQIEQALANMLAVLRSAGMEAGHLVKLTGYLTRREDVAAFREIRDRVLGGARPASTMVLVAGLVAPEWLVEIEAVAAAP